MPFRSYLSALGDRLLAPRPIAAPRQSLDELGAAAARELEHNILPFWLIHARNRATGGFWGEVTSRLRGRRTRLRSAILTSRILWTFSAAYRRVRPDPEWLAMATYARDDLLNTFRDPEYGGVIWSAAPDGTARDRRKQIYGQTFAIYGLSEYYRATRDPAALEEAIALYRLVETHARDRVQGGYIDLCQPDWSPADPPGSGAVKSMGTMLHLVEPYANLYRAWPDPALRGALQRAIETVLLRAPDATGARLDQYFRSDWTPVSDRFSYGHDLEFCWLAVDAARCIEDAALLEATQSLAVRVAGHAAANADPDGGLVIEVGPAGVTDAAKHWWVQAEAAIAFLDAYEISGDQHLFAAAQRSWAFIENRLVDRRGGEWFSTTTRGGRPKRRLSKISFWKCPYHNGRACMEIADRAARLSPGVRTADLGRP